MEPDVKIDVAALDAPHRRALEEMIGRELAGNHRLIISVTEVEIPSDTGGRNGQTVEDWTGVYEGLSDAQIESIDTVAKTRADLTRNVP